MRLHADEGQQRRFVRLAQEIEITKIGLDVFVHGVSLDFHALDRRRRHAPNVGDRAVGHEAAPEPLDVTA